MATYKSAVLALVCILLLGLSGGGTGTLAAENEVRWLPAGMPAPGEAGNWVLAPGSDIQHLTVAGDGTLYAYGKGLPCTLLKSTDGGHTWSCTGKVSDIIVDIAVDPAGASVVYYATASSVYKSADAGFSFILLPPNPGGAGNGNVEITSIDVTNSGNYLVAVGTRDTDNGEYGGIYLLDEGVSFTWEDTGLAGADVYALSLSPYYPADRQLVAVATDETDTFVTTRFAGNAWGADINNAVLDRDNSGVPTPVPVVRAAAIAFPDDYTVDMVARSYTLFIAVDTGSGTGDVYRIDGAVATDLNTGFTSGFSNIDVHSLAVTGNGASASLLAGLAGSGQVYFSHDGGWNWTVSTREATGQSFACVAMAADFTASGKAYVATSGAESAFSYTEDGGITWNQIGLIDTAISDVLDLAPSPRFMEDSTLFMITWGGAHSLWRSLDGGERWERICCSAAASIDSIRFVALPPDYSNAEPVVFIAGSSGGSQAIWRSSDNGQCFSSPWPTHDPVTGVNFNIDTWLVAGEKELFVGSFDGLNGLVYHSSSGGWMYDAASLVGSQSLYSLALSPGYVSDGAILAGNTSGWVYLSRDNGTTFKPLPAGAVTPPLSGSVSVAFDAGFGSNNTVYTASDSLNGGVHRFKDGTSSTWESIDGTLPLDSMLGQLVVAPDGALYAANIKVDSGIERCLNPSYPLGPTFETVTRGLYSGATLGGLWLRNQQLWSFDTTNNRLMAYIDSLTQPVNLVAPSDAASGIGNIINYKINNIALDWDTLAGATEYCWQINCTTDFSSLTPGFEGNCRATTAILPPLDPSTTYYWRVRVTEPVLSPWTDKWSFVTSLGSATIAPHLLIPEPGGTTVDLKPLFQWSGVVGADRYELLVSADDSFTSPAVLKIGDYALPSSAWQCGLALEPETTYYWKVRAFGSGTSSVWSAVGAFTTKSVAEPGLTVAPDVLPPVPDTPSPAVPSPLPPVPADLVIWLIYIAVALSLVMLVMLITLIILTLKIWKL